MDKFDKEYTDYWQRMSDQGHFLDNTKVAGEEVAERFLPYLGIKRADRVLDAGCSFGRFFPLLSRYSDHVSGMDIEATAVRQCSSLGYTSLKVCPLEAIDFPDASFEKVFCWGTFDCVEQEQGLLEISRVLAPGGKALVTGKNRRYRDDDVLAFIAERNAKLKNFPNHFTDTPVLRTKLSAFGLQLDAQFNFVRRGDIGSIGPSSPDPKAEPPSELYEWLMIFEKVSDAGEIDFSICTLFSDVATRQAKEAGMQDIVAFFAEHKRLYP